MGGVPLAAGRDLKEGTEGLPETLEPKKGRQGFRTAAQPYLTSSDTDGLTGTVLGFHLRHVFN